MDTFEKMVFNRKIVIAVVYVATVSAIVQGVNILVKIIDNTTIKFVLVGIINTAVGTAVMFVLYNLFCANYWFASAMNYVVGSTVSYFLNKYFTFQNTEKSFKQVIQFIVNITVCYLLAYGIAKPVVRFILSGFSVNFQENVAMLAGMCIFVGLNYVGQRFVVFRNGE